MPERIAGNEARQIRFAVVMYGGGSLAIYINGIAQELLKMVRATAADRAPGDDFDATEQVYRRLALLLSNDDLLGRVSGLTDENQLKLALHALLCKNTEELQIEQPRLYRDLIENNRRVVVPAGNDGKIAAEKLKQIIDEALKITEPKVRFMVDVLSGSSAGGINGVFLAKALVNNQKIDDLKKLWLHEGDFQKLLNDKRSIAETELAKPGQPQSLLNSQRMYLKLLEALDGMDNSQRAASSSPNVDEIDLYVTVTDYTGVKIPMRLADRVVSERRHKQFFHFRYEKANLTAPRRFARDFNPFLAFAARSTSAFPLAFEPMRLADIDEVIDRCKPEHRPGKSDSPEWRKFFEPFNLQTDDVPENRYFLDGGALDNKPFGFALNTLLERQADVPVDRKLIYIEPTPEFLNAEVADGVLKKPDALENLIAQGSTLPRYETIREDLHALIERNRFVERINRLVKNTERTVYELYNDPKAVNKMYSAKNASEKKDENGGGDENDAAPARNAAGDIWENYGFTDIVESKGRAFLPYYRLRLISLTDNLARPITRFFGFSDESDYFLAVRSLIRYWRETEFVENKKNPADKTANYFLRHFDYSYRLRRLRFVLRKVEQLALFPKELRDLLESIWIKENQNFDAGEAAAKTENDPNLKRNLEIFNREEKLQVEMPDGTRRFYYPGAAIWHYFRENSKDAADQISAAAGEIQVKLKSVYDKLKNDLEKLNSFQFSSAEKIAETGLNDIERELFAALSEVRQKIGIAALDYIIGKTDLEKNPIFIDFNEQVGFERASKFLEETPVKGDEAYQALKRAGEKLDVFLKPIFETAGDQMTAILKPEKPENQVADLRTALLAYLFYYYENYDDYDQVSFPVYFQTNVGEADTVDIIRISPHDAKNLIDEENSGETRRKLAGGALAGFGAFLDVAWRQNDIMWGRLDGAERLIAALLPSGAEYQMLRKALTEEAHSIILREEFLKHNTDSLAALYSEVLLKTSAGVSAEEAIRQAVEPSFNTASGDLRPIIQACLRDSKVRETLAAHLDKSWKSRGEISSSTIETTLDSPEVQNALGEYFESNSLTRAIAAITHQASNQKLRQSVQTCLDENAVNGFMRSYYQVNRRLEPQPLLRVISRATQVIGKLFEGISEKHAAQQNQLQWIARLGQMFWGLIEVAAPNSLFNLLFLHWLKLLYFFLAVLIFGATVLVSPATQKFGIVALILTLALHVSVLILGDLMRGRRLWRNILFGTAAAALALLAASGALFLLSFLFFPELWKEINTFQETAGQLPFWLRSIPAILIVVVVLIILIRQERRKKGFSE